MTKICHNSVYTRINQCVQAHYMIGVSLEQNRDSLLYQGETEKLKRNPFLRQGEAEKPNENNQMKLAQKKMVLC